MSLESSIKTMLEADATTSGYLTGGIYTFEGLGRIGINRKTSPSAMFDANKHLLPLCIIQSRNQVNTPAIRDVMQPLASYMQMVRLIFYDDGDNGFTTITAARNRVWTLLHGKPIGEVGETVHVNWYEDQVSQRDYALDNACYEVSEYQCFGIKGQ